MEMSVSASLPREAVEIREEVFMWEQGFTEEFDRVDFNATHLVLWDEGFAVGTCRFYEVEEPGTFLVGRIAVRKPYRGQGLGAVLVREAESHAKKAGAKRMLIHAQNQAVPFYQKQGYLPTGKTDEEQGCPHTWLEKALV